jgi:hypothetical protein
MRISDEIVFGAAAVAAFGCAFAGWERLQVLDDRARQLEAERAELSRPKEIPQAVDESVKNVPEETAPIPVREALPPPPPAHRHAQPPAERGPRRPPLPVAVRGKVLDAVEETPVAAAPRLREDVKTQDEMRRALRRKQGLLELCFNEELKKQAAFNGFVLLKVSIGADGAVKKAQVEEGNRRDRAVGACIASHLKQVRLPAQTEEADLLLPILLEAKSPSAPLARNEISGS